MKNYVEDIMVWGLYRHFKGGYYIVTGIVMDVDTLEQKVTYASLKDGVTYVRKCGEFCSDVPKDRMNPTGQTKRFYRVDNFDNQLSSISTDRLVDELLRRPDSPFFGVEMSEVQKTIVYTDYVIGRAFDLYSETGIDEHKGVIDYDLDSSYFDLESAKTRLNKINNSRYTIMKRVLLKGDFD